MPGWPARQVCFNVASNDGSTPPSDAAGTPPAAGTPHVVLARAAARRYELRNVAATGTPDVGQQGTAA